MSASLLDCTIVNQCAVRVGKTLLRFTEVCYHTTEKTTLCKGGCTNGYNFISNLM